MCEIKIIKQETPIFETACDNIGFKLSKGKYIIEIQADIEIQEKSFEKLLSRPCEKLSNVLGVSGRCCHGFFDGDGFGKLGFNVLTKIENLQKSVNKDCFYSLETCNRGPLLLDKEKLKELNYLDEKNFYLDNSDHDLFARGYYEKKYICGYVPIEFSSPLENGSTRKPRDSFNIQTMYELKNRSDGGFLAKLCNFYIKKQPIIYKFNSTIN